MIVLLLRDLETVDPAAGAHARLSYKPLAHLAATMDSELKHVAVACFKQERRRTLTARPRRELPLVAAVLERHGLRDVHRNRVGPAGPRGTDSIGTDTIRA